MARALTAVFLLVLAVLAPLPVRAEGPVRIAFIGTMTGPRATTGRDSLDVLTLAFSQFA